jgi:hypothetical protein
MFNSKLGQALFKILPDEVSSSIAYQDSRCTETRKNHVRDLVMDSSVEALRHGMASTHLDT